MRLVVGLHPKRVSRSLPSTHSPDIPHADILNKLAPPTHHDQPKVNLDDYTDPDVGAQAANTRHLSKYVFPRQYGLRSPFQGGSTAAPSADYGDREAELKMKGRCKTPKRLKPVLPLLDKMLWRHKKCGYMPLRDLACPSKVRGARLDRRGAEKY
ncbi:hypothetical protein BD779DRAFT_1433681 [Infundibulicybe gibba]|nr:hypothetical protein BD779DRAFT_1433681 [Infundibulicybe gibba]